MVRFLLVLALADAVALGVEWMFPGVPVAPAAAAAVRAEQWRLLFGLALLGFGGLFVIFASMLGVFERARAQVAALRETVILVVEDDYA